MSMNFKKTAIAAGMFTALAATSMSAHAIIEGDAGEANLVPFVIWDDQIVGPPTDGPFSINTVVKITVPMSVGNKTIPNVWTAQHSTPTNGSFPAPVGPEAPADPDIKQIHWAFLNQRSVHRANGTINVTPDDVAIIDWGDTIRRGGYQTALNGVPGYLLLTTEQGWLGKAADFSFFAEAWLITGADFESQNGGGTIGLLDAKIPVLPMADGADSPPNKKVSVANQVIEIGVNGNPIASPLISGIPTTWSDGSVVPDLKIVDLTLGNRSITVGNVTNPFQIPTLFVVWNDRNADAAWSNLGVVIYNDNEEPCSDTISLPNQLNVVWAQTDVSAAYPVPSFIQAYGQARPFCVPPIANEPGLDPAAILSKLLQGGFIKLMLPELIDTGIGAPEAAMMAFSIPLQYQVNFDAGVPVGATVIPMETALGHDRGSFTP
ncbi:hypothetical protein [Methylococcus geothermalis]|uniref:Uncharacterized protein n=1 Tax=Methylococcus geothermalis TaxID=2681310 RepID=A0A858QB84_9GAMM|nr:hypothetical protein [Methylococcus geothermalis]QJD31202.1 hypothetical protein GNH96_15485 [Methylococcus geothermalis]